MRASEVAEGKRLRYSKPIHKLPELEAIGKDAMRKFICKGQTIAEYALVLAGLALVAYGLSPTVGYNFLDDAITALLGKVISLL